MDSKKQIQKIDIIVCMRIIFFDMTLKFPFLFYLRFQLLTSFNHAKHFQD